MRIVLISTYELGRQPFGLASPTAWLRSQGHAVTCTDLAVEPLRVGQVRQADLIAFYLPMHTATRLAISAIERVRALNPKARLCCYGLYAALNESCLRGLGVETILGGEFEQGLVEAAAGRGPASVLSTARQKFLVPDRSDLPPLARYAHLRVNGARKLVGYTEASRGCKRQCRHCPVVPVYNGQFRIVQAEVVLEDIRRHVAAGAQHITFGDPDFLNGPGHALRLVEALHAEFPSLTCDVTIRIEHLRKHRALLPRLRRTGCVLVTSAIESVEDQVLAKLDKGHTCEDVIAAVQDCRAAGLTLAPTFVPFTPWTTRDGYRGLLRLLLELDLVENVSPVQLALRLLIPAGSRLLDLPDIRTFIGRFDEAALVHPWKHPDPSLDALSANLLHLVWAEQRKGTPRAGIFRRVWELACGEPLRENYDLRPRATIPYLDEPWYC